MSNKVKKEKFTRKDFNKFFPNDDVCLQQIFDFRCKSTQTCPKCNNQFSFHKVEKRKCYACSFCGYQIHPLANTIFHKS